MRVIRKIFSSSLILIGIFSACGIRQKVDLDLFCKDHPTDADCKNRTTALLSCDPSTQPDASLGVFVAPGGSDTSGDGSRERPYATLATAVTVGKPNVYVAPGTYRVEQTLELSRAVTIDGGWTPSFQRACESVEQTVLQGSVAAVSPVVRMTQGGALAYVTVATVEKAPAAAVNESGATLVGVQVTGGEVTLQNAQVRVGAGGDGGPAEAAGTEVAGAVACNGVSDCLCAEVNANPFDAALYDACVARGPRPQGGASAPAAASASETYGVFTAEGYRPGDGAEGAVGPAGQNGINGSPAAVDEKALAGYRCLCAGVDSLCVAPSFCNQYKDSSSCSGARIPNASEPTLANGKCGCGGQGGRGGKAGRGGGASVGVVVTGGSVQVKQTQVTVGAGGNGSAGGNGGLGGEPTSGQAGTACSATDSPVTSACEWRSAGTCIAAAAAAAAAKKGGSAGGDGAKGGLGNQGGPGAGGPSLGIVTLAGAQAVVGEGTEIQPGAAGKGAPGAPDGEAAAQKAY